MTIENENNEKEKRRLMSTFNVDNMWQPWIEFWTKPASGLGTTVAVPDPVQQKTAGGYCIETKIDMRSGVVTVRHEFGW